MKSHLKIVLNNQNKFSKASNFEMSKFQAEPESQEYFAHRYSLGGHSVVFRIAKKTPAKTGFFVTLWKRATGSICPLDQEDPFDLLVVNIIYGEKLGQFVFPKSLLISKQILSTEVKKGKTAFRVYSPWDEANSPQAKRSKQWQVQYFVDLSIETPENLSRFKSLYS